ncbi:TonB-dependent receptor, partial [Candidatus Marinimicrobia bacterium]|nr:TonB-dependent receptor [Candidatus Neomarinimicrobiota bacterium]
MYSAIIVGTVKDEDGSPIIYANVYLKDTFDGTSSDDKGSFAFETFETGNQTLIISFIGYESYEKEYNVDENLTLDIILKQLITRADEVVITAGSFGASDDEKVIVLDPIDIVTVASSRGEISGALEALPGTQPQADKEGVYVRGGDASEAKQIVDGMLIQNPYFSDVPDIPQRGRFEPFDFQGTAFSQGGYSAQYGQALSAIVDLKTWTRFGDFNANTFGITPLSLGYGRGYGNDSTACGINIDYSNIEYFQNFNNSSNFIKSRVDFTSPPEGLEIKTNYAKKFKNGIYKYIGRVTDYSLGTKEADIGSGFNLDNKNLFLLSTYKGKISKNWRAQFGISYSENSNDSEIVSEDFIDPLDIDSYDDLFQLRTVFTKKFLGRSKINFGIHLFDQSSEFINYTYEFDDNDESNESSFDPPNLVMIDEFLSTAFTELDLRLFKNFAINAGIRYENSKLLDKSSFSPRFSSAIKVTKNSQISYAYGVYYQTPDMGFDQWYRQNNLDIDFNNSGLDFEKSIHNILNYEWSKKKKTVRFEIFNKKYENLVVSNSIDCGFEVCKNNLSNEGFGYSRG